MSYHADVNLSFEEYNLLEDLLREKQDDLICSGLHDEVQQKQYDACVMVLSNKLRMDMDYRTGRPQMWFTADEEEVLTPYFLEQQEDLTWVVKEDSER